MSLSSARLVLFGELGVQKFRHGLERKVARSDAGAIQDESRSAADAVTGFRFRRYLVDPRIISRVLDTLIDLFLAHARNAPQQHQPVMHPFGAGKGWIE